jgi:hypothetical protein
MQVFVSHRIDIAYMYVFYYSLLCKNMSDLE